MIHSSVGLNRSAPSHQAPTVGQTGLCLTVSRLALVPSYSSSVARENQVDNVRDLILRAHSLGFSPIDVNVAVEQYMCRNLRSLIRL
jgi:hypothetical protein